MIDYDEFGMLADNAAEVGLTFVAPSVRRTAVTAGSGLELSALVWGDGEPELVLLHGGAQNAHTWDTVALILDRPLVALDLPGHGHSAWRHRPARAPCHHPGRHVARWLDRAGRAGHRS
jgi:pimeloyl-ACP methyl ester carboxylesterase